MSIIVHQDLGVGVDAKVTLQTQLAPIGSTHKIGTIVSSFGVDPIFVLGEDWHEVRRAYSLNPVPVLRFTLPDGTTIDLAHAQPVVSGSGKVVSAGSLRRGDEVMGRLRSEALQAVERTLGWPLRADEWVYYKQFDGKGTNPADMEIVREDVRKRREGAGWAPIPRFEVRPIKLASVKKLDKKTELCRLVCRPYFANGLLLASA